MKQINMSRRGAIFWGAASILIGLTILLVGCSSGISQSLTSTDTPMTGPTTPATVRQNSTPTQTTSEPTSAISPVTSTGTQIAGKNIIIDHNNWDQYDSQPLAVLQNVAKLKVFFAHASVGGNILQGMRNLNNADRMKYPIQLNSVKDTPPATTQDGTIYEYDRGNPSWSEKISSFESYLKNGWIGSKVDLVMNKFCYIDPTADWKVYRDSMTGLEARYPGTKFIYWTMPLTINKDSDEALRSQFNQNLRNWIATQKSKILFDLADIEAWDPAGNAQTFIQKGLTNQILYSGYAADEGHLNSNGWTRAATGLYSLLGDVTASKP